MPAEKQSLRVLHLEDSSRDAALICDRLDAAGLACNMVRVDNKADFETALATDAFDLILCDYNLPGYDGLSALQLARATQPLVPIIMISGSFGEDQAVQCLHSGATDYLLKQRMDRFVPAVRRALQEAEESRKHRQAEVELRESEERHRLMFQRNPLPMWVYDVETLRFLAVNKNAVVQYGYSEAEFLAMTIRDIRPPADLAQLNRAVTALETGKGTLGTWRHRKKNGAVIDVEVSSEPFVFSGRPARLVLARDITDRIVAERTRRRLAAVMEFSLDVAREPCRSGAIRQFVRSVHDVLAAEFALVLILDEKTNRWNAESWGWESECDQRWTESEFSELIRGFMTAGRVVRQSASTDSDLTRHLAGLFPGFLSYLGAPLSTTSRTFGWCSLVNKIGTDGFTEEDEEAVLSFASQMALTLESRRAETALNAAERRFHDIVQFAPVGIYQATRDGRLLMANETLAHILGFESVDALMTLPIRDLYVDYDEHIRAVALSPPGQSNLVERRMRRRDGSEIQVRKVTHSVHDEQGEVLYDEAFLEDVTALKASEEHGRLLQQSLNNAKRVDSLGRVAATVAHEFNNVLMGIQPFAEVIYRRVKDDLNLEKATASILNSVNRGKGVTSSILRFTNPSLPRRQVIQASHWLATLEPELRQLAGPCRLVVEVSDGPLSFAADPHQLEQTLSNLVVNARQAMDGGGSIHLRCSAADPNTVFSFGRLERQETFVQWSVSDEGSGIPDNIVDNIFDPLFTTKRTGTGLGLSVVAQLIEQHGGKIGLETSVGKGTTFHVLLPGVADPSLSEGASVPGPARCLPKRLLLVEDEAEVAEGLAMLLELDGIEVTVVSGGGEVAAAVERFNPEMVVLDFGLPDMDGSSVYTMLEKRWPRLPVVVSSGHAPSPREGLSAFHLQKPYPYEVLVEALSRALASKETA